MTENESAPSANITVKNGLPLDYDLATVDGAAWVYFVATNSEEPLVIQRNQHATGLVIYSFSAPEYPNLAAFVFRALQHRTQVLIGYEPGTKALSAEQQAATQRTFNAILSRFVNWLLMDMALFAKEADRIQGTLEELFSNQTGNSTARELLRQLPKPARGRPTSQQNTWVRNQIKAGHAPDAVFSGYLVLEGIDPTDDDSVRLARERFRKAARPLPGRKSGRKGRK